MSEETQRLADILAAALWVHGQYQGAYAGLAAVYPLIFEAGRQQGLEEAAKKLDALGVGECERGSLDYTTGVFECRRLECGDCNCSGFDEVAEAIRALKQKEQSDV